MRDRTLWGMTKKLSRGLEILSHLGITESAWNALLQAGSQHDARGLAKIKEAWPGMMPTTFFDEPKKHREMREILGEDNFHGIGAAEKHFGRFSAAELSERMPIRLRNHKSGTFLSEKETFAILRKSNDEYILCATHPFDLSDIWAWQKEYFFESDSKKFRDEANRLCWAGSRIEDPWIALRKELIRGPVSTGIDQTKDLEKKFPEERFALPAEFAYVHLTHFLETDVHLFPEYNIASFPLEFPSHISVQGGWSEGKILFANWGSRTNTKVGTLTIRTS